MLTSMHRVVARTFPTVLKQPGVRFARQTAKAPAPDAAKILNIPSDVPVIKIPTRIQAQIDAEAERRERSQIRQQLIRKMRGDNSPQVHDLSVDFGKRRYIISCKNSRLNHRQGQTYRKFATVRLASESWKNNRSYGDHFTISCGMKNPAMHMEAGEVTFDSLNISEEVRDAVKAMGIKQPSVIQVLSIREVLQGVNSVIAAETGSGKTLSYLLPVIQQILDMRKEQPTGETERQDVNSPKAVIVVPGRELTEQIGEIAQKLAEPLGINVHTLVGGNTKYKKRTPKTEPVDIVVGSIGILNKFIRFKIYNVTSVQHVVLDEADTLLDDTFSDEVLTFLSRLSGPVKIGKDNINNILSAQLTLVAATLPRDLSNSLKAVMNVDDLKHIKTPYLHRVMPHVPQLFFRVSKAGRAEKLLDLLRQKKNYGIPTLIFSNDVSTCKFVSQFITDSGIICPNLHGDLPFQYREGLFKQFQERKFNILSCTDTASRGLDTVHVEHVINFQFPLNVSDYIHRCGRTGRLGSKKTGCRITNLVAGKGEASVVQKIEYSVRKASAVENVNANIKRIITGRVSRLNPFYGISSSENVDTYSVKEGENQ